MKWSASNGQLDWKWGKQVVHFAFTSHWLSFPLVAHCLVVLAPGCHLDASKSLLECELSPQTVKTSSAGASRDTQGGQWKGAFSLPFLVACSSVVCFGWLCLPTIVNCLFQTVFLSPNHHKNGGTQQQKNPPEAATVTKRNGNSWRPVFFRLAFPLIILAGCACQGLSSVHIMQLLMSSIIAKRWNDLHPMACWTGSGASKLFILHSQATDYLFHWSHCLVVLAPGCHLDVSKILLERESSPQTVKTSSAGASRDTQGGQWNGTFSLPFLVACSSVVCFGWLCLPMIVNCLFQTVFLSPNYHKNGGTQQQKNPPETATGLSAMGTLEGQSFSGLHFHWSFWLVVLAKDCLLFTSCSCSCPQSLQKDEMICIQWPAGLEVGQASCSFCIHKPLIVFSIGCTLPGCAFPWLSSGCFKKSLGVWIITTNCENVISWCLQRHTGGSVKRCLFFAFPRGLLFSCLFWLVVLANDCQLLVSNCVF